MRLQAIDSCTAHLSATVALAGTCRQYAIGPIKADVEVGVPTHYRTRRVPS